jgi:mannose-6-phosphate isomerase-like protein (cupin superfamily)
VTNALALAGKTLSGETLVVGEWRDDGQSSRDRPIAPPHLHRSEDEAWYVLEGCLGFKIGDSETEAGVGEAVLVPAGTPHTYWNAATALARYLIVMGPRTARLIEAIHATSDRDAATMRRLFEQHDSELLL